MATFNWTIDNGAATCTLTASGPTQKVLDIVEDAGRYVYPIRWQLTDAEGEPILYDALTLAQKKGIIAAEWVYTMKEQAKTYHATSATDTARETAIEEAEDKYDID